MTAEEARRACRAMCKRCGEAPLCHFNCESTIPYDAIIEEDVARRKKLWEGPDL